MDYFINEYNLRCKKEFDGMGFKRYKNNHYRVINDVFQSFNLHRSIYGNQATIEFGVIPLSYDYLLDKSSCRPQTIREFENNVVWYPYTKNVCQSIDQCIDEMFVYVEKYLIPYFEKMQSCKEIYKYIYLSDELHFFDNYDKMLISLKNNDYVSATESSEKVLAQAISAYVQNYRTCKGELSQKYVEKITNSINSRIAFLQRIVNNDKTFFEQWLLKNEHNNLERIKWKIKNI